MIIETMPISITDDIRTFCKQIISTPNMELSYIPVCEETHYNSNHCFENVENKVLKHGGKAINGWTIWQRGNMYLEAEAHSVWQNTEGKLIDITPKDDGEDQILFLQDDSVVYKGYPIQSQFYALTESSIVQEYVCAMEIIQSITSNHPANVPYKMSENEESDYIAAMSSLHELEEMINQKVGRNDPCPCGSGLKYKKCCLPYCRG